MGRSCVVLLCNAVDDTWALCLPQTPEKIDGRYQHWREKDEVLELVDAKLDTNFIKTEQTEDYTLPTDCSCDAKVTTFEATYENENWRDITTASESVQLFLDKVIYRDCVVVTADDGGINALLAYAANCTVEYVQTLEDIRPDDFVLNVLQMDVAMVTVDNGTQECLFAHNSTTWWSDKLNRWADNLNQDSDTSIIGMDDAERVCKFIGSPPLKRNPNLKFTTFGFAVALDKLYEGSIVRDQFPLIADDLETMRAAYAVFMPPLLLADLYACRKKISNIQCYQRRAPRKPGSFRGARMSAAPLRETIHTFDLWYKPSQLEQGPTGPQGPTDPLYLASFTSDDADHGPNLEDWMIGKHTELAKLVSLPAFAPVTVRFFHGDAIDLVTPGIRMLARYCKTKDAAGSCREIVDAAGIVLELADEPLTPDARLQYSLIDEDDVTRDLLLKTHRAYTCLIHAHKYGITPHVLVAIDPYAHSPVQIVLLKMGNNGYWGLESMDNTTLKLGPEDQTFHNAKGARKLVNPSQKRKQFKMPAVDRLKIIENFQDWPEVSSAQMSKIKSGGFQLVGSDAENLTFPTNVKVVVGGIVLLMARAADMEVAEAFEQLNTHGSVEAFVMENVPGASLLILEVGVAVNAQHFDNEGQVAKNDNEGPVAKKRRFKSSFTDLVEFRTRQP